MDADIERSVLEDANRVVLDPELLGFYSDEEATGPDERALRLREANLLAGLLWQASTVVIDHLMEDAVDLWNEQDPARWRDLIPETWVMSQLPERFWHKIAPGTVTRFLVVTVDLTARLTQGWRPPSCVAQELMLRVLLNQVEVLMETYEIDGIGEEWRANLEDRLFEDVDHEFLYDPSLDGFEDDPDFPAPPGMTPMSYESWFVPFNRNRRLPPFAEEQAPGASL